MSEGFVVTFYSYKGGVGRSFLLANVAATLSRWGYRVLCVDFDLEAPGLTHYFDDWKLASASSRDDDSGDEQEPEPWDTLLSDQQKRVAQLLIEGSSINEIAVRLGFSPGTAKMLVGRLYHLLRVNNRTQALYALRSLPLETAADDSKLTDDPLSAHPGLLELVEAIERGDSVDFEDFIYRVGLPEPHAPIALMPAGRHDELYMSRIQELDWARLYAERDLGASFERIRAAWTSQFDFVLIDSRTGVSDSGGICTAQLPDLMVAVFAANRQNIDGILEVAAKAAASRNELPYDRQGLITIPVLSRFDQRAESELAQEWLKFVSERLQPLLEPWTHREVSSSQFFDRVVIPYFSALSFGEDVPAIGAQENVGPERIEYYIDTIAALVAQRGAGTAELISNRDSFVAAARTASRGIATRPTVYLSYSTSDVEYARALSERLTHAGVAVFFDIATEPSTQLSERISEALRDSTAMVALIGERMTRWQTENIRMFLGAGTTSKPVIPVVLSASARSSLPRFLLPYKELHAEGLSVQDVAAMVAQLLQNYLAS